jgi:hypothetical protein
MLILPLHPNTQQLDQNKMTLSKKAQLSNQLNMQQKHKLGNQKYHTQDTNIFGYKPLEKP